MSDVEETRAYRWAFDVFVKAIVSELEKGGADLLSALDDTQHRHASCIAIGGRTYAVLTLIAVTSDPEVIGRELSMREGVKS